MNDMAGPRYSILIPSIGRNSLVRTLSTVGEAARQAGAACEIVVADDSLDGRVQPIVDRLDHGGTVRILRTASGNISTARNACLDTAKGDYLLFIDDDEWVQPDWVVRHVSALESMSADACFGPVSAHYEPGAPAWIVNADPFSRNKVTSGQLLLRGTTANAIVRRSTVERLRLRFDESLGRSGGEDSDFFARMRHAGGRLAGSDSSVCETIPLDRCSSRYLGRRAIRHGQTFARNALIGASSQQRWAFALDAMGKLALAAMLFVVKRPFGRGRVLRHMLQAFRNYGKLRELRHLPLVIYYAPQSGITAPGHS